MPQYIQVIDEMKTLLLLRHAKSSWANEQLSDFERPLNERGHFDAPRIGELLRVQDLVPDLIISSSAKRAATTAEMVAISASFEGDIRYTEKLYLAESETYIALARQVPGNYQVVMMVGHNPGIEELVEDLTGQSERMPTAALACIELPIEKWSDMKAGKKNKLRGVWRPKEL